MSFSQKDYLFSHTITKSNDEHQPVTFKIDLSGIIPCGDYSTLFVIDSMSITAYKQGTLEKIPVKFTVLNDTMTRGLTNDPCKLASKWQVGLNGGSCIKLAGTDIDPFNRTVSVYDEENRQALVNVLAFMMSNSLWASDRARGTLEILVDSSREQFEFTCKLCSETGIACVMKGASGPPISFSFPRCADGYVCVPCQQPCTDKVYEALLSLLALLRSVSNDNLDILKRVNQELCATSTSCQELDCPSFPPRHMYRGSVVMSHALIKYITSLYQTMSEYANNFAIVDKKTPHIKVLIESPSANMGEITGRVCLTIIYGSTLLDIYSQLSHGLLQADECEANQQQQDNLVNITQLSNDVLLRRTSLHFMLNNHMSLQDWYNFYYG